MNQTSAPEGLHRAVIPPLVRRHVEDAAFYWMQLDGGKALRKAIIECSGALALIQRCQEHKRRNVIEHLPQELHASISRALRDAWEW
jgi:putative transposase